jgi:hypothetical protein
VKDFAELGQLSGTQTTERNQVVRAVLVSGGVWIHDNWATHGDKQGAVQEMGAQVWD